MQPSVLERLGERYHTRKYYITVFSIGNYISFGMINLQPLILETLSKRTDTWKDNIKVFSVGNYIGFEMFIIQPLVQKYYTRKDCNAVFSVDNYTCLQLD